MKMEFQGMTLAERMALLEEVAKLRESNKELRTAVEEKTAEIDVLAKELVRLRQPSAKHMPL